MSQSAADQSAGIRTRRQKSCAESFVRTTELVLPNDTNTLNNLMGGRMMHLMDVVGAISAQRFSGRTVVTASVDSISFNNSIRLGDVVTLEAQVTRSFNSSMEIHIVAYAENIPAGTRTCTNEAFFTFVAVDQAGRPIDVPEAIPNGPDEVRLFESALRRRQVRLLIAKRIKPDDASELRNYLFEG